MSTRATALIVLLALAGAARADATLPAPPADFAGRLLSHVTGRLAITDAPKVNAVPSPAWSTGLWDEREIARSRDHGLVARMTGIWSRRPRIQVRSITGNRLVTEISHGIVSTNQRLRQTAAVPFHLLSGLAPVLVNYLLAIPIVLLDPGAFSCGPSPAGPVAAFSPDGTRLAIAHDGRVRIFRLPTGRRCGSTPTPEFARVSVRFSEDGRRLVVSGIHRYDDAYEFVLDGRSGRRLAVSRP